jgi:DNA-binding response OmpR family regulator/Flp pilus assembly protein TadD
MAASRDGVEPTVLLVGAGERFTPAFQAALGRYLVQVETAELGNVVDAVIVTAPDLVLLMGEAAKDGGSFVLQKLSGLSQNFSVPVVVLHDEAELDAKLTAFRHGATAVLPRSASVDATAAEVAKLAREIPEQGTDSQGGLGEATLDEFIAALSRELKSGLVSSLGAGANELGDSELKLVLGRGRPLTEFLDQFVRRVRRHVVRAEPLRYELGSNVDAAPRPSLSTGKPQMNGLRVALADDETPRVDAVAQELRRRGVTVVVTDLAPSATRFQMLRQADPTVLVVGEEHAHDAGYELLRRLRRDSRLRWSSLLVVRWNEIWTEERGAPTLGRLESTLAGLAEPERTLSARAAARIAFETQLEVTGPARCLRTLAALSEPLRIHVDHPRVELTVDLSEGLVVGAEGRTREVEPKPISGVHALSALLVLGSGRVRVEPVDQAATANVMTPVEAALTMADAESPPITPSVPAASPASVRPPVVPGAPPTPSLGSSPKASPAPGSSPKASPSPGSSPKASPPRSSPKASASPGSSPKASPSPGSSPKASPSPGSSPKAAPTPSLGSSPKASPAPGSSPKASPPPASSPASSPASAALLSSPVQTAAPLSSPSPNSLRPAPIVRVGTPPSAPGVAAPPRPEPATAPPAPSRVPLRPLGAPTPPMPFAALPVPLPFTPAAVEPVAAPIPIAPPVVSALAPEQTAMAPLGTSATPSALTAPEQTPPAVTIPSVSAHPTDAPVAASLRGASLERGTNAVTSLSAWLATQERKLHGRRISHRFAAVLVGLGALQGVLIVGAYAGARWLFRGREGHVEAAPVAARMQPTVAPETPRAPPVPAVPVPPSSGAPSAVNPAPVAAPHIEMASADGSGHNAPSCSELLGTEPHAASDTVHAAFLARRAGRQAIVRGDLRAAHAAFCRAAVYAKDDPGIALDLALVLLLQRDGEQALERARFAVEHEPRSLAAKDALGDALARTGNEAEARSAWLAAARIDAGDEAGMRAIVTREMKLADKALRHGDLVVAERAFRRAAILEPKSNASASGLALVLLELGDVSASLHWARRAVAAAPRHSGARLVLGDALAKSGDQAGAAREWREAVSLDPANREAQKRLRGAGLTAN